MKEELNMLENEPEIVERAKNDDQAFEILYGFYFPKIYSYIFRRVGSVSAAEDLVSTTFINVFDNLKKYQHKGYTFGAWVYRIATNNLIDYYRKSARTKEVSLEGIESKDEKNNHPDEMFQQTENRKLVQQVMEEMPNKYQQVLYLKFFADMSTKQMAETLETNENNIRVLTFRALKRFKQEYKKYEN